MRPIPAALSTLPTNSDIDTPQGANNGKPSSRRRSRRTIVTLRSLNDNYSADRVDDRGVSGPSRAREPGSSIIMKSSRSSNGGSGSGGSSSSRNGTGSRSGSRGTSVLSSGKKPSSVTTRAHTSRSTSGSARTPITGSGSAKKSSTAKISSGGNTANNGNGTSSSSGVKKASPTAQTPYVPRSLQFDLTVEKKKRLDNMMSTTPSSTPSSKASPNVTTRTPSSTKRNGTSGGGGGSGSGMIMSPNVTVRARTPTTSNSTKSKSKSPGVRMPKTPMTTIKKKKSPSSSNRNGNKINFAIGSNSPQHQQQHMQQQQTTKSKRNRSSVGMHLKSKPTGMTPATVKKSIKRGRGSVGSIQLAEGQRNSSMGVDGGLQDISLSSPLGRGHECMTMDNGQYNGGIGGGIGGGSGGGLLFSGHSPISAMSQTSNTTQSPMSATSVTTADEDDPFDLQVLDSILETNLQMSSSQVSYDDDDDDVGIEYDEDDLDEGIESDGDVSYDDDIDDDIGINGNIDGDDITRNDEFNAQEVLNNMGMEGYTLAKVMAENDDDDIDDTDNDYSSLLSGDANISLSITHDDDDNDDDDDVSLSEMLNTLPQIGNTKSTTASTSSSPDFLDDILGETLDNSNNDIDDEEEEVDLNNLDILFTPPAVNTSASTSTLGADGLRPSTVSPSIPAIAMGGGILHHHHEEQQSNAELEQKASTSTSAHKSTRSRSRTSNVSCSSDTAALSMNPLSNDRLEDILAKGGEAALDRVLELNTEQKALNANVDDVNTLAVNATKELVVNSEEEDGEEFDNVVAPFHSSFINNSPSLDNQYLRANLKSALIALRSVKAERRDIEVNVSQLQGKLQDARTTYTHELNKVQTAFVQKDTEVLNLQLELSSVQKSQSQLQRTVQSLSHVQEEMEMTRKDLDHANSYWNAAELEVESHKSRHEDLEQRLHQLHDYEREVVESQEALGDALYQISVLKKQLLHQEEETMEKENRRQIQFTTFGKKCEGRVVELDHLLEKANQRNERMEKELEICRGQHSEHDALAATLKSELKRLASKVDDGEARIIEQEQVCDELRTQNEDLLEELSAGDAQLDDIVQHLKEFESNIIIHKAEDVEEVEGSSNYIEILQNVTEEIGHLKEQIVTAERKSQETQDDHRSMGKQLEEMRGTSEQRQVGLDQLETALQEIKEEKAVLEQESYSKAGEITSLKEIINRVNGELALQTLLNENEDDLEQELEKAKEICTELEEELSCKDDELVKMKIELETKNSELMMVQSSLNEKEEQDIDIVTSLSAEIGTWKSSSKELQEQFDTERERIAQLEEAIDEKTQELNRLITSRDNEVMELKAALSEAENLKEEALAEKEEELTTLNVALADAKEKNVEISHLEEALDEKTQELNQIIRCRDEEIAKLKADLNEAENFKEEVLAAKEEELEILKESEEKAIELQNAVNQVNLENSTLKHDISNLEEQLAKLLKESISNSEISKESESLAEELHVARMRFEPLEIALAEAEEKAADLQNRNSEKSFLKNDICDLEEQLAELSSKNEKLKDSVQEKEEEIVRLQSAVDQTRKGSIKADSDSIGIDNKAELEKALESAQDSIRSLEERLVENERDASAYRYNIRELQKSASELQTDNESLEQRLSSKDADLDDLRNSMQELVNELEANVLRQGVLKSDTITALKVTKSAASYAALEAANGKLQHEVAEKGNKITEIEAFLVEKDKLLEQHCKNLAELERLNSSNEQLQENHKQLILDLESKHTEIGNLHRELKLSQLEAFNTDELGEAVLRNTSGSESQSEDEVEECPVDKNDKELGSGLEAATDDPVRDVDDTDAKEAVKELLAELNCALSEKEIAIEALARIQKQFHDLKEDCTQRELETIALESSLRKALSLSTNNNSNELSDETRIVISELVEEIGRIKKTTDVNTSPGPCDSCDAAKKDMQRLAKDLMSSDETADLEAARADSAERKIKYFREIVEKKEVELCHAEDGETEGHVAEVSEMLNDLIQALKQNIITDSDDESETDFFEEEIEKSRSSFNEKATNIEMMRDEDGKSFVAALDQMLNQSSDIMRTALDEFNADAQLTSTKATNKSEMGEALVTQNHNSTPMIEFHVYESLRSKYDLIEAEREDLLNETFALMDSSAAANAAEVEAIVRMVEKQAALDLEDYKRQAELNLARVMDQFSERGKNCICQS
uniref:Uncharacterized protein n=1 Tax=Chaetoceros debilis TaxID=122233 RepID=A0A7S3Q4Q6_9STRA